LTKAGGVAAMAVVAVSPSQAYVYSGPEHGPVSPAAVKQESSLDLGIGHVYIMRASKPLPYPLTGPPELYKDFNAEAFVDRTVLPFGKPVKLGTFYMLGSFDVV
jgi:hypothetical protein